MIDWKTVPADVKAEHDRLYREAMDADREYMALRAKGAPFEQCMEVRKRYRAAEQQLAAIRERLEEQRNRSWN